MSSMSRPRFLAVRKDQRKRVSVFMPSFCCRQWLRRAICSVLGQIGCTLDLYVVDDCSGDVDDALLAEFPDVNFLRTRHRSGPYGIFNALLALTESEYVAFHDADDFASPNRLRTQIAYLLAHRVDACGSWCILEDECGDVVGFQTFPENAASKLRQGICDPVLHPTTLHHRRLFDRLRGFDSSTRFGADTEFLYRACLSSEIGNVQKFLYSRLVHPRSLTQTPETAFGSPARVSYLDRVHKGAERVRSGKASFSPGVTLLTGEPIPAPSSDLLEILRVAKSNVTFRTKC
jgi:glycosyltransferase involved in cell wall biosynthesis